MPANSDLKELFKIFNEESVEYLLVGAHAVAHYAEPRYTKDVDLWVAPSAENAARVWRALNRFTAPMAGVSSEDFSRPDVVFQMGVPPNRIDILTGIDGIEFDEAWPNRIRTTYGGEPINILGKAELIRNKRASGRPQDLLDLQRLLEPDLPRT